MSVQTPERQNDFSYRQYQVRRLEQDDIEAVYGLCQSNPRFYEFHPPFVTRESILEDMKALPPGKTMADKYFMGFWKDGVLTAILDLIIKVLVSIWVGGRTFGLSACINTGLLMGKISLPTYLLTNTIINYPQDKVAFIGLFMTDAACQNQGVGSGIIQELISALAAGGFEKVRLAIDEGNPQSEAFWQKNHFIRTGERYPAETSVYIPMERSLKQDD